MNAKRMYSFAITAALCCTPALAQIGSAAAQPGGSQSGVQSAPGGANDPNRQPGLDNSAAAGVSGPAQDKVFVKKALEGSMAEVQLGQLALQKSNDAQVKEFAQRMVDDHTKMLDQMKPVAQQVGVAVPASPSKSQMKTMDKLKTLSGDAFDQAYIKDMVKDHKEDDADFKREASSTQNPKLREVVQQGDQVIEMHLQHIEKIAKSKGNTKSSGQS